MLFQEVGFDIVSLSDLMGWPVRIAIVVLAIVIVYVITRALSSRRRNPQP